MTFTKPWKSLSSTDVEAAKIPVLDVFLKTATGKMLREAFVVDAGADVSMAPAKLADRLGLDLSAATPVELRGISPKEECVVSARILDVEIHVLEANCRFTIPFCFADGDAPTLIGREGFFDRFLVSYDKRRSLTVFQLSDQVIQA